ncbi:PAH-inducible cytochrome P450 monooxygenase PC-PAH 1 [Dendrothele bispora CBS 962.96]|uniref:PAH-inducible cytochrome P450 monooxygenase PC-PAH 1 n=1 Tax=Dendrothele bispora (strain CBS 962.96) TaxID=1314807 RepID=A0A4S8M4R4_DENBC|nr:PAH-inducible cytochrome P450 monooxygenase PC-PAH 1 [Dendrothele bispora CBS 962.96]
MPSLFSLLAAGGALLVLHLISRITRKPLSKLRGPKASSLLAGKYGYEYDLFNQKSAGDKEYKWYQEYGTAFRINGPYGEEVLMTADPKALQHILQTSGKSLIRRRISRLFDKGVVWAEGDIHQRHRKVLNPAFSAQQLRQFLAIFRESVSHLTRKWKEDITQGGSNEKQINIPFWLSRMTLDIIGKTSFDFDFGALDNKEGVPLRLKFQNLFQDSVQPTKANMVHRTLERYAPSIFRMFPSKEDIRHRDFANETRKIARDIYARKDLVNDEKKGGKDILSVLARANHDEDPKKRLNDSEVLAQVAILLSGQETISFSTTYLLYELSRHLEDQTRVYHEIRNLRAQIGQDKVPSSNDYDSMPYFNAVIKEALRLHSILIDVQREAVNDDVIPLEFPVTTLSGETVNQIPVRKGQRIHISLGASNRLKCVWGPDASDWNPSRFLEPGYKRISETNVGVTNNLCIRVGGGNRACIGWLFALMEMQSILFGLLESFEFVFPTVPSKSNPAEVEDEYELQRVPLSLMIPAVKGTEFRGPAAPLQVKIRHS